MVAAKAPKRCHYSGSGSLKNRVQCAVAQKNIGMGYVNKVNSAIGISPGRVYAQHALRKDTERKRQKQYQGSIAFKRRRLELKFNAKSSNQSKEIREGVTYKSGVANTSTADITEIPPPQFPPLPDAIAEQEHCNKIFCDIETGSLHKDADILQISAVFGGETYNQYITPTRPIATAASAVTALTSQGCVLFHNGTPVNTLPLMAALHDFLAWLTDKKTVMLIGHNFRSFDFPRLLIVFKKCNLLNAFKECVIGISDTLHIFRDLFPGLDNYKQEHLFSRFLNMQYEAHNALADVKSLQQLCRERISCDTIYYSHSITTTSGIAKMNHESKSAENSATFQGLLDKKVISKTIAQKMGQSGLCLGHIQLAYTRGGQDGLKELLAEKVDNKVRVTSTKKILTSLVNYFDEQSMASE